MPFWSLVLVVGASAACSDAATGTVSGTGGETSRAAPAGQPVALESTHAKRIFTPPPRLERLNDFSMQPNGMSAWSQTPDSPADDLTTAIVADSVGNFVVAGSLAGTADIGCGSHTATNAGYVAKYRAIDGVCLWATYMDGDDFVGANALAVGPDGFVYVTGNFASNMLVDNTEFPTHGNLDGFIVKLAPADGAVTWTKTFGGTEDEYLYAIAVNSGHVAVAGAFNGTSALGGDPVVSQGDADGFIVEYNDAGAFFAQQSFGDTGWDAVNALAFDGAGNLVADGTFVGTVAFDSPLTSAGGQDAFVAIYDATLTPVLSRQMGGVANDAAHGLVLDGANVVVSGYFQSSADLGDVASSVGSGQYTAFIATYAADLSFMNATLIASPTGEVVPEALASDAAGGVVLTGHFTGTVVFGGTPHTATGGANGFVATYASDGTFRWANVFGNGTAEGLAVASAQGLTVVAATSPAPSTSPVPSRMAAARAVYSGRWSNTPPDECPWYEDPGSAMTFLLSEPLLPRSGRSSPRSRSWRSARAPFSVRSISRSRCSPSARCAPT